MVGEHECSLNLHFGESTHEADRIRQKTWESLCQLLYITEQINAKLPKKTIDNNPNYRKISFQVTEYELVNEIFEPFEQVSQVQALPLGATFEMLSGGPAQTHVGTGGGGSSSDMSWGEKKNACNTSRRRR